MFNNGTTSFFEALNELTNWSQPKPSVSKRIQITYDDGSGQRTVMTNERYYNDTNLRVALDVYRSLGDDLRLVLRDLDIGVLGELKRHGVHAIEWRD